MHSPVLRDDFQYGNAKGPSLFLPIKWCCASLPRYFRKDNYFGLSCFQNMPVDSEMERGARMKSVGILATSYTGLYKHMQFLENQVR